jgi:type II secretory pathway pseudopilin PulG
VKVTRLSRFVESRKSEAGDTLVEVLLSIIVLGLAAVALMIAFSTSIAASAVHRQLATSAIVLDSVSQEAISGVQQQQNWFTSCLSSEPAVVSEYNTLFNSTTPITLSTAPYSSQYSAAVTSVQYWTGSSFGDPNGNPASCPQFAPQKIVVTVTDTSSLQTYPNTFVVNYPLANAGAAGSAGPASRLVFTTQPVGGPAGIPFATQPVVAVQNASGNPVSTDLSPVTLTVTNNAGVIVSGCSGNEIAGVVTFSGCLIASPGTYTLSATNGIANSLVPSASFTISASANHLVFTTQPTPGPSGTAFTQQPVVMIENTSNAVVSGNATLTLTASSGTLANCSGASLTTTTGVFNLSGCTFAGAFQSGLSTYYALTATSSGVISATSNPFLVSTFGVASQLVFTTQPSGIASASLAAAFPTSIVVTVEDSFGNVVTSGYSTSITLTPSAGESFGGSCSATTPTSGVATFSGCTLNAYANSVKLTATSGILTVDSVTFNVTGIATKLVFTTSPVASTSGSLFTTQPVVAFEDASGNVVTSSTAQIVLTPSGGTLSFCSVLTPTAGIVNVASCSFAGTVGTNYTLTASSTGLTSATSTSFSPAGPGVPSQLVFITNPVAGVSGALLTTQPIVKVEDSAGNVVLLGSTTISLSTAVGTLSPCANLTSVAGVVTVANCAFAGVVGTPYVVTASAAGLTSATATITPTAAGVPYQIVLSGCASNVVYLTTCTATASIEDVYNNIELGDSSTIVTFTQVSGSGSVTGLLSLPVTSGVATDTLTGTVVGSAVISASGQSIASNSLTITVIKANQTITFTSANPSPVLNGGATYTPTASGGASGNAVVITLDGTSTGCSLSAGVVSFTAVGTCKIDANQAGNANYNAAPQVQQSITVNKGNQTITFTSANPSPVLVGGPTYTPTASATSGLGVTFTLDGTSTGCSLSAGVVSFTAVGTCVVDANQAGTVNWNAAPQVQQSITVNKGNQTVNFGAITTKTFDQSGLTLGASATSGLAVSYSSNTLSICTVNAGTGVVTFVALGTCSITAAQVGNVNWNAATPVTQTFTINAGNQTESFTSANPSPVLNGGPTYTPTASATSGLAVVITLDGTSTGCSLSAGVVSFTSLGTCKIDANQAGNANWNAATQVQQSIVVRATYAGGSSAAVPSGTNYYGINVTGAGSATQTNGNITPGVAETLASGTFNIGGTSNKSYVFTIGTYNGTTWTSSGLSCTIASGATSCNVTGPFTVPIGNAINVQVTLSNGITQTATWTVLYSQP